jgi:hypothetical protein
MFCILLLNRREIIKLYLVQQQVATISEGEMIDRAKHKHIVVFTFAFALFAVVPLTLMYVLTNVADTLSIQSDALHALLTISPMMSCVAGIAIAMLHVCRHPEIL